MRKKVVLLSFEQSCNILSSFNFMKYIDRTSTCFLMFFRTIFFHIINSMLIINLTYCTGVQCVLLTIEYFGRKVLVGKHHIYW
jgi:hypothetical protein